MNDGKSYKVLLRELKTEGKQLESLKQLAERLVFMSEDESFLSFPLESFSDELVSIIYNSHNEDVLILATQCCMILLNLHDRSFKSLNISGIHSAVQSAISKATTQQLNENCLGILCSFAFEKPMTIVRNYKLSVFLDLMPKVSIVEQRRAIQAVQFICQDPSTPKALELLNPLMKIMNSEDQVIRQFSGRAFLAIINSTSPQMIPTSVLAKLPNIIINASEISSCISLTSVLFNATKDSSIIRFFSDNLPDFEGLLMSKACIENASCSSNVLKMMQVLMPTPKISKHLWPLRTRGAATNVEPFKKAIIRYICQASDHETTAVCVLAACASLSPLETDLQLISVLLKLARAPKAAPYVLSICSCFKNPADAFRSGLVNLLQTTQVSGEIQIYYNEKLKFIQNNEPKNYSQIPANIAFSQNLKDIIKYIEDEQFMPYQFMNSTLMDKCRNMIFAGASGDTDLSYLVSLAFGVMQYYLMPTEKDPFKTSSYASFSKKSVTFKLGPSLGIPATLQMPILTTLLYAEGWFNMMNSKALVAKLKAAIKNDIFLRVSLSSADDIKFEKSPEIFAVMSRSLNLDGYKKCSFFVDDVQFSAYDSVTYVLSRVCPTVNQMRSGHFIMKIVPNEVQRNDFFVQRFESDDMNKALDLLSVISLRRPDAKITNQKFSGQIISKLSSPLLTMLMFESSIRMIYTIPGLFSFGDRSLAFKAVAIHPIAAAKYLRSIFEPRGEQIQGNIQHFKFSVDRSRVLDVGLKLIEKLGYSQIAFDITFFGEKGIGEGPTREFFSNLSKEFCRTSMNIWRNSSTSDSLYAVDSLGLFPRPDADNNKLELLGLLVSKALTQNRLLDIPFNPAFWKILLGMRVNIEEVDPVIANSLQYKEGLYDLNFTYPGIPSLELKPGGSSIDVDESNVNEYINLVKEFTCGQNIMKKAASFLNGFNKNIPFHALRIFSPEEINSLICGDNSSLTKEEMRKYIKPEHGYDSKSPEINMFIEMVSGFNAKQKEKLIKFITGSNKLPVGGLGGLDPPLTIAKRIAEGGQRPDDTLPSVMTCTNYFKLPQYSSIDVMKERILYAIDECSNSFELS